MTALPPELKAAGASVECRASFAGAGCVARADVAGVAGERHRGRVPLLRVRRPLARRGAAHVVLSGVDERVGGGGSAVGLGCARSRRIRHRSIGSVVDCGRGGDPFVAPGDIDVRICRTAVPRPGPSPSGAARVEVHGADGGRCGVSAGRDAHGAPGERPGAPDCYRSRARCGLRRVGGGDGGDVVPSGCSDAHPPRAHRADCAADHPRGPPWRSPSEDASKPGLRPGARGGFSRAKGVRFGHGASHSALVEPLVLRAGGVQQPG